MQKICQKYSCVLEKTHFEVVRFEPKHPIYYVLLVVSESTYIRSIRQIHICCHLYKIVSWTYNSANVSSLRRRCIISVKTNFTSRSEEASKRRKVKIVSR